MTSQQPSIREQLNKAAAQIVATVEWMLSVISMLVVGTFGHSCSFVWQLET